MTGSTVWHISRTQGSGTQRSASSAEEFPSETGEDSPAVAVHINRIVRMFWHAASTAFKEKKIDTPTYLVFKHEIKKVFFCVETLEKNYSRHAPCEKPPPSVLVLSMGEMPEIFLAIGGLLESIKPFSSCPGKKRLERSSFLSLSGAKPKFYYSVKIDSNSLNDARLWGRFSQAKW
jgi:hypothetical protein